MKPWQLWAKRHCAPSVKLAPILRCSHLCTWKLQQNKRTGPDCWAAHQAGAYFFSWQNWPWEFSRRCSSQPARGTAIDTCKESTPGPGLLSLPPCLQLQWSSESHSTQWWSNSLPIKHPSARALKWVPPLPSSTNPMPLFSLVRFWSLMFLKSSFFSQ